MQIFIWRILLTEGFKIFKFTKPQKIGEFSFSFQQINVVLRSIWRNFLQQNKLSSSRKFVYILQIKIWLTVKRRKALEYSPPCGHFTMTFRNPDSKLTETGNSHHTTTNNSWNLDIFAEFYSVFWNSNEINVFLLVDFSFLIDWITELLSKSTGLRQFTPDWIKTKTDQNDLISKLVRKSQKLNFYFIMPNSKENLENSSVRPQNLESGPNAVIRASPAQ